MVNRTENLAALRWRLFSYSPHSVAACLGLAPFGVLLGMSAKWYANTQFWRALGTGRGFRTPPSLQQGLGIAV